MDIFQLTLKDWQLIEASAGTGKTYTITSLYLRLLLDPRPEHQQPLHVGQILVVTYTRAATEELRERIREKLRLARAALTSTQPDTLDADAQALRARYGQDPDAIKRLTLALRGFDEAAIFTIHGFCQRVLSDAAFESAQAFSCEFIHSETELLRAVVEDFWRKQFYHASPLLVEHLLKSALTPEKWLQLMRPYLNKPYLHVRYTRPDPERLQQAEQDYQRAYTALRACWWNDQDRQAAYDGLCLAVADRHLKQNIYSLGRLDKWRDLLRDWLSPEQAHIGLDIEVLEKFSADKISRSRTKNAPPIEHRLYRFAQRLVEAYQQLQQQYSEQFNYLRYQLLDYCSAQLLERKRQQGVQSFDDLLSNLASALHSDHGEALAASVHQRYPAALIDEFQDTDPVQYSIFQRIYQQQLGPVFLVGDPKQAIYSFRGADIFAYLHARRSVAAQHSLEVNWRSTPQLIKAVNTLFMRQQPFWFEQIPFIETHAAERGAQPLPELQHSGSSAPLQLWLLPEEPDKGCWTKEQALRLCAQATAQGIVALLNEPARIGEQPLQGSDIAVLVRTHDQGRAVRAALLDCGVPSVLQAQDSVFSTAEAQELEQVLQAIAEPTREGSVRAALSGVFMGETASSLWELQRHESRWEARLAEFARYHTLWLEQGFMRMFRAWLQHEQVAERLLSYADGERRLTNVLHLAELLQQYASQTRPGMEGLIKWLAEARQRPDHQDETAQLRLESDEQLVKIVTIHKSKGLQYPLVFCPFLWDGRKPETKGAQPYLFHSDDGQAILELGSSHAEQDRERAIQEALAEDLRLLYVALTRAQYQCTLIWGAVSQCENSALAWLLHGPQSRVNLADFRTHLGQLSWPERRRDLTRLISKAPTVIAQHPIPDSTLHYTPPVSSSETLQARKLRPLRYPSWRIGSFTSLVAHAESAEQPDYDQTLPTTLPVVDLEQEQPSVDIFNFPRGAEAGVCLHALLERSEFTNSPDLEFISRTLQAHALDAELWTLTIAENLQRLRQTALVPGVQPPVRLADIPKQRRLVEMGFEFAVDDCRASAIRQVLSPHLRPAFAQALQQLEFREFAGFIKGFIDLLFLANDGRYYLLDYKSNWLGAQLDDYRPECLEQAMAKSHYYLQYLIYSVALHRHLRLRLADYDYQRHFGGAVYVFLRGLAPELDGRRGVFFDRPSAQLIDALDRCFGG